LVLLLLECSPAPFSREHFTPGHITCTGLVFNPPGDRVLTVHHRRLNRWLLPGGHIEPGDTTIEAAARREVLEETGVQCVVESAPVLAGIDVHGIPSNGREPYHLHHDLLFYFHARTAEIQVSDESHAVVWRAVTELETCGIPSNVRLACGRAARR